MCCGSTVTLRSMTTAVDTLGFAMALLGDAAIPPKLSVKASVVGITSSIRRTERACVGIAGVQIGNRSLPFPGAPQ